MRDPGTRIGSILGNDYGKGALTSQWDYRFFNTGYSHGGMGNLDSHSSSGMSHFSIFLV